MTFVEIIPTMLLGRPCSTMESSFYTVVSITIVLEDNTIIREKLKMVRNIVLSRAANGGFPANPKEKNAKYPLSTNGFWTQ